MSKASDWARQAVEQGITWHAQHNNSITRAEVTPKGEMMIWGLLPLRPEDALSLADFIYQAFLESPPSDDVPF